MDETQMQHGRDWCGENVTGWWVSEKFDGCRAYWDGKTLWSRGGVPIQAPFLKDLPAGFHLDGEIWAGYGRFQEARCAVQHDNWTPGIRFMVFDAPGIPGDTRTRLSRIVDIFHDFCSGPCVNALQWKCTGMEALHEAFRLTKLNGGEGLIARHPELVYEPGRTDKILKIKSEAQFARRKA